jgi:hypothetical protein
VKVSITTLNHNAERRVLFTIMLNVVMLNVIILNVIMLNALMLSAIMLNVVMLSVAAPQRQARLWYNCGHFFQ